MILFGLTGGIACGKSTIATFLRESGVGVVDADLVAREVVQPGTDGLRAIVQSFGEGVLAPDGTLDRKALGALVFGDEPARQRLNAITHPLIREASMKRAQSLGNEWIAYEAALLVEVGQADAFRPLVVVTADEGLQLSRLMARDGLTRDEAMARVRAQMPLAAKVAVADYVIDTSCSLEETRARTVAVIEKMRGTS